MSRFTDEELRLFINQKADVNLQERIEQALAQDAPLAERIAFMRELALGYETKSLKETLLAIEGNEPAVADEAPKNVRSMYTWLGVAASLLLLLGFWFSGFKHQTSGNTDYLAAYLVAPLGLPTPMSDAGDAFEFMDAMVSYKMNDFATAENKWSTQLETNPSDTLQYYLAAAKFGLKKYEDAASYFQAVYDNKNSAFNNSSSWHLGLIKLKQQQIEAGKSYLQQCNHPKKEELLKQLP